jgi:hypothetical protein
LKRCGVIARVDKVDLHTNLFDLGGNSLQFIAMIHKLEKSPD